MDTQLSQSLKKQRFSLALDAASRGVIAALMLTVAHRFLTASNSQEDPTTRIWLFAFFTLAATTGVLLGAYACFPVGRVISLTMALKSSKSNPTAGTSEKEEDND